MQQIEQTKQQNIREDEVTQINDNGGKKKPDLADDRLATLENQLKYPLCKPIKFSNPWQDDYINSDVWKIQSNYNAYKK